MTDFQDKTTTNVNYVSGEQLSKEVFISLNGLETTVRGLTVQTQKAYVNKVSNIEFYGRFSPVHTRLNSEVLSAD